MGAIKSRERVRDHGEVFTPSWMVDEMLDLVKAETERIDARFLEPACGNGNFLIPILERKLRTVEHKYRASDFEKQHYALLALMCVYGIELLQDNVVECRRNLLRLFADSLNISQSDDLYHAAFYVISQNIVHGDALKMRTFDDQPITFAEWGYVGKGKYQRRDFSLQALALLSDFNGWTSDPLLKQTIFAPIKTYPRMSIRDLAAAAREAPNDERIQFEMART